MENMNLKVYRVYRKDIKELPCYSDEYMTKECVVVATSPNQAKGIALNNHESMLDQNYNKKDILVEEIVLKVGMELGER